MFIFTQPYISPLARSFIEANPDKNIMDNDFLAATAFPDRDSFLSKDAAKDKILQNEGRWIYTNTEDGLILLDEILPPSHRLRECIALFKNKHLFRQRYQDIFPGVKFSALTLSEVLTYKFSNFNQSFIIKPAIGFLSAGVYRVNNQQDLEDVQSRIVGELSDTANAFPKSIIDDSLFLLESVISGREFAIDAFIDDNAEPVIVNIFEHVFMDNSDMSDRLYVSSTELIRQWLTPFTEFLYKLSSGRRPARFHHACRTPS